MGQLAAVFCDHGRFEDALPLEVAALADRTRLLGEDHPDTLTALNNLAMTYDRMGKYAEVSLLLHSDVIDRFRAAQSTAQLT